MVGPPPLYRSIKPQISLRSLNEFLAAEADRPFCLLDGKFHSFPFDKCLSCSGYEYCNFWRARYLTAVDKILKIREGKLIVRRI